MNVDTGSNKVANQLTDKLDLQKINKDLASLDALSRIAWAADQFNKDLVLSSSFGQFSAVMLDLTFRAAKSTRVVFVDTGYLLPDTYRFKHRLIERMTLDVHTFIPQRTRAERDALNGNLEELALRSEGLREFNYEVKVEPLERGFKALGASAWMSGVMKGETAQRDGFDYLMQRDDGLYKFHPILDWDSRMCYKYLEDRGLPMNEVYRDIFKPDKGECGIHLTGIDKSFDSSQL